MNIVGSKFVVTGASGNLAKGLCKYLCDLGAEVVGLDLKQADPPSLDRFKFLSCDLTDEEEAARVFSDVGALDVLVNLAGQLHTKPVFSPFEQPRRLSVEEWQSVVDANLRTCFVAGSLAIENMIAARRKGLLINISSIMARGQTGQSAYAAAKAGVEAMGLVWAKELSAAGIRCVTVAPGFFETDTTFNALSDTKLNEALSSVPSKRLGHAAELYDCIESIIRNDYFNGTVISLDGGVSLR